MSDQANKSSETEIVFYLRLFVTGASPNSARAIANINSICEEHIAGKYAIEIIDVHQEPDAAAREQIIALPLLIIKSQIPPERRLIGDMRDTQKVLRALGIHQPNEEL